MKWTIGIITNGSQNVLLQQVLNSVWREAAGCDLVVVGGNANDFGYPAEFTHVPFEDTTEQGWITKKKNLITQHARYDNICYMHDYIGLEPGWRAGVESFGDDWMTCMHRIINTDGTRYRDWCMISNDAWMDPPIDDQKPPEEFAGRLLNYDNHDWGRWQYYSGAYFCAKKHIAEDVPLDEERVQGQGEDVQWSRLLYQKYGQEVFTMNPNATVRLLKYKQPVPWQRLSPL